MLDTLLKSSECIFFEKLFWVPFGVPRFTVKSHLYASSIYFLFKIEMNSVILRIVWVPNLEIKASKFYISHVIMKCLQDFTTL